MGSDAVTTVEPTYVEEIDWKGTQYVLEFFKIHDFSKIAPKTQAAGICFTDDDNVVLYKNIEGYFGLPGGTIEEDETPEQALRREVMEEATCKILTFGPIGYFRTFKKEDPSYVSYQLRYWAKVELLEETPDPAGKSTGRVVISFGGAASKLGWGERGKYLIKLAREEYLNFKA